MKGPGRASVLPLMRWSLRSCLALGSMAGLLACGDEPKPGPPSSAPPVEAPVLTPADLPKLSVRVPKTPKGSMAPNLFVTPRGELLLSWLEPADPAPNGELRLRLKRRTRDGWQDPLTITEGALFSNWADVPAVGELADGTLVATWLVPAGDDGRYETHWSRSTDGGDTWAAPQRLHEHTGGPDYGFVSMAQHPDGRLAVYWLDGRRSTPDGGQMELRTALIGREGPPAERGLVDDRVCDCCPTAAASTPKGPVVAYRNRSGSEVRDIHVAGPHPRLGEPVHDDDWLIVGCPVNGPSLAAVDQTMAIAWFTAADDEPRVRAAFGRVGGQFGPPIHVDMGHPLGRVSLVMPDERAAIVTYIERSANGGSSDGAASIVVRRVTAGAQPGPAYRISSTTAARSSGVPRSAIMGDRIIWAWTSVDEDGTNVLLADAPLDTLG